MAKKYSYAEVRSQLWAYYNNALQNASVRDTGKTLQDLGIDVENVVSSLINQQIGQDPARVGKTLNEEEMASAKTKAQAWAAGESPSIHLKNLESYRKAITDYGVQQAATKETQVREAKEQTLQRGIDIATGVVAQTGGLSPRELAMIGNFTRQNPQIGVDEAIGQLAPQIGQEKEQRLGQLRQLGQQQLESVYAGTPYLQTGAFPSALARLTTGSEEQLRAQREQLAMAERTRGLGALEQEYTARIGATRRAEQELPMYFEESGYGRREAERNRRLQYEMARAQRGGGGTLSSILGLLGTLGGAALGSPWLGSMLGGGLGGAIESSGPGIMSEADYYNPYGYYG